MKTLKNKKILFVGTAVCVFALISLSFKGTYQDGNKKPWKAPDASVKMKNPVAKSDATVAEGKTLYMKHCKSCHGAKGLGDGPKSKELDTNCGDFSTKETASMSDGELFYKIKEGRDDMPSFKKKITDDEEIWSIVNFMRTLAK